MDPLLNAFAMLSAAVVAGSLLPRAWLPAWLPNDKLLHVGCYAAAAALLSLRFAQESIFGATLAGCFVAGIGIEAVQQFIPGREFCARDIAANGMGIMLGAGGVWLWGAR